MPICTRCSEAADGLDFGPVPVCSECGVGPVSVYRTDVPLAEQKVVRHKREIKVTETLSDGSTRQYLDREWCPGSSQPPKESTGHDFCNGCPCQHRPKGAWKGGS